MKILMTILVLSSITGVLALVLSVANRTIGNYGIKKLLINGQKQYEADGGNSLLSVLVENEVFVPSACGGKGSCGYCKVKVIEGGGDLLSTETGFVSPSEAKDGMRLSCQVKVKEDISIEIPEELFNVKQFDYNVKDMIDVTDRIKHLKLELPEGKEISFKPGQYVQLLTPKYKGSDEEVYRAYSLASSPVNKDRIELLIGYEPDGICTTYVHRYLNKGDKLTIVGPYGDFHYRDSGLEMVLVAIGTGMAPLLSILRYMKDNSITDRKVSFYFGARSEHDLFLQAELSEIKNALPLLEIYYTLSRPENKESWNGETGRVTDAISRHMGSGEGKEAYLCGSPVMIDSVVELLISSGMKEEDILYDKFA